MSWSPSTPAATTTTSKSPKRSKTSAANAAWPLTSVMSNIHRLHGAGSGGPGCRPQPRPAGALFRPARTTVRHRLGTSCCDDGLGNLRGASEHQHRLRSSSGVDHGPVRPVRARAWRLRLVRPAASGAAVVAGDRAAVDAFFAADRVGVEALAVDFAADRFATAFFAGDWPRRCVVGHCSRGPR